MLKSEILNAPLLAELAKLGHTDIVVVADFGLPIPRQTPVVDLAFVAGQLGFAQAMEVLTRNLVIESSTLASEARGTVVEEWCTAQGLVPGYISHEELKAALPHAKLVIRTGEATAYANIVLSCGVPF